MPVAPKLNQAELQAVLDTFSFDNPGSRIGGSTCSSASRRSKEASSSHSSPLLFRLVHSGSDIHGNSWRIAIGFGWYMGRLVSLSPLGRTLVSAAVILLLTIANSAGLRFGKTIQNVFALAKVGGLVWMVLVLFAHPRPNWIHGCLQFSV